MRRVLALFGVLVLLGAMFFLWDARRGHEKSVVPGPTRVTSATPDALAAPAERTEDEPPARVAVEEAKTPRGKRKRVLQPRRPTEGSLAIRVLSRDTEEPLPRILVGLDPLDRPDLFWTHFVTEESRGR